VRSDFKITITPNRINIGSKNVEIQEKFTLILGKFKKELITQIQNENLFELLEDFNSIYLQDFVNIFENQNDDYNDLDKGLKLVEFLEDYRKITKSNSELIMDYIRLMNNLISIIEYNNIIRRRESLQEELELSKIKQKSGDIAAKTDLINKLKESISHNNSQLKFFEEDYKNLKNQINQINQTIKDYNQKIQNLNKQKKEYFSNINKITREMSEGGQKGKNNELILDFETKELSKADTIKELQRRAKESQYEIKQIQLKSNETKIRFNEINPRYKILDTDYQKLKKTIKNDRDRLEKLQNELKDIVKKNEDFTLNQIDFNTLEVIRETQEIEDELSTIKNNLINYEKSIEFIDNSNPLNLSILIQQFQEFNTNLTNKQEKYLISIGEDDISECIKNFRKLEMLKNKMEVLINKFLLEINLKCIFNLTIDEKYKSFTINLEYVRSNKEITDFDNLTTPEKVFFLITFFISIKILLKSQNIIFSNLFLPAKYNKRGSVFRTISKAISLFENEKDFKDFNLIFIISSLEMKKPIENLRIINMEEIK
jgi:chromosome segregation ATPase